MQTAHRYVNLFIKYLNNTMLFAMFIVLLLQVILRRFIDIPWAGAEEWALLTMVWITFLGAYQCTVEDSHLKMDFLQNVFTSKWSSLIQIISKSIVVWFLFMANVWAYPFIQSAGDKLLPMSKLLMWVPYGIIWIACILMFIEVIYQIVKEVKKIVISLRKKEHNF